MQNVARRQNRATKNRSVKDEYNAETQREPHLTAAMPAITSEDDGKAARCYNLSHRFSHERRIHDFAVPAR